MEQSQRLKTKFITWSGTASHSLLKYRIEKLHGLHIDYLKTQNTLSWKQLQSFPIPVTAIKQSGGAGQFAEVHMRVEPFTKAWLIRLD